MKKIIIFAHTNKGGGAETYIRAILPRLAQKNQELKFILYVPSEKVDIYKKISSKFDIREVSSLILESSIKRMWFDWFSTLKIINKEKPSLVMFNNEMISPFSFLSRYPKIIIYHATLQFYLKNTDLKFLLKNTYVRCLRKTSIMQAQEVIAVSHYERAEIGAIYKKYRFNKVHVIYHGVDKESFSLFNNYESKKIFDFSFILSVSDLHEHKRHLDMIKFYNCAKIKYNFDEHLVIIGGEKSIDYLTKINDYIRENDLSEFVHIIPYVDNADIGQYFKEATVFWNNSRYESFGLTPMEALASGIPVLSVWEESIPEIYGYNLYYYRYIDGENVIADKLNEVISNLELRKDLIEKGFNHITYFSWEEAANQYIKIFKGYL